MWVFTSAVLHAFVASSRRLEAGCGGQAIHEDLCIVSFESPWRFRRHLFARTRRQRVDSILAWSVSVWALPLHFFFLPYVLLIFQLQPLRLALFWFTTFSDDPLRTVLYRFNPDVFLFPFDVYLFIHFLIFVKFCLGEGSAGDVKRPAPRQDDDPCGCERKSAAG